MLKGGNDMILAINTAFANSDVALCDNEFEDYESQPSSARQSENILVCVDNMLSKHRRHIQDVECVSVVVGPGSFTGIRIGVGIVKGFCVAKPDLKLISICSLDLMAHIAKDKITQDFWCVINALSGNIFVCKYNKSGERITQPEMLSGERLNDIAGVVVGLNNEKLGICNQSIEFSAMALLSYTKEKYNSNEFVEENNLLPIYLRKSQAEMNLENKDGN